MFVVSAVDDDDDAVEEETSSSSIARSASSFAGASASASTSFALFARGAVAARGLFDTRETARFDADSARVWTRDESVARRVAPTAGEARLSSDRDEPWARLNIGDAHAESARTPLALMTTREGETRAFAREVWRARDPLPGRRARAGLASFARE